MSHGELEIIQDPKAEIKFWHDMYTTDGYSRETKALIEKCLVNELRIYTTPTIFIKNNKEDSE